MPDPVAVLLLLLAAVGLLAGLSLHRNLRRLRNACQRVAAGNYTGRLKLRGILAGSALGRAFNDMQHQLEERETRIVYQSQHDRLTGLPNRSVMMDRVETAIARAHRAHNSTALVTINIRRFREINDSMGQHAGDRVLQVTAERLRGHLRETDTVIRLDSDEFLLILEDGTEPSLRQVISNLLPKLNEPVEIVKTQVRIDYMTGAAFYPQHGEQAEELLRRADIALNFARENHESLHVFSEGEDAQHLRRLQIIEDLPDAINTAKMFLVYQPKVSMRDRRARHAEALVRWVHPQLGFVPPDEFVHLAEQSGYIRPLTHLVIRTAVNQLKNWTELGVNISVAINLSALDLLDPTLPDVIKAYLNTYKVSPRLLAFEITESVLMQEPDLAIRVLNQLREHDIRLSIDDFGTGYSSLAQLKRLPVDELKIDRSFIMEIKPESEDAVIVRSTIDLAHNLGLRVVAEGVENEEAWDLLTDFGCDFVQGYLISKPLKPGEFEDWWAEYNIHRVVDDDEG